MSFARSGEGTARLNHPPNAGAISAEALHNEITSSRNVTLEQQSSGPLIEAFGFEALWAKPNIERITIHSSHAHPPETAYVLEKHGGFAVDSSRGMVTAMKIIFRAMRRFAAVSM